MRELLREQRDVQVEFAEPRFSARGFHHPDADRPGTAVAGSGFLLDEDPRLFDTSFFGITDLEAETMDASQRKLLEVTYEAFENAGETWESVSGARVGVFVGDISLDGYLAQAKDWENSSRYSATGAFPNMLANRLHYVFNLKGPSLVVNSACTSAMYALHLAVASMRNGDCDSAVVAGSNWIVDPSCHMAMGKLGALSPTSRSHTFDASADGYARGEGFVALYLKTSSQAIRDAAPIRALIVGTAVNANGRTNGIVSPSGPAQESVIREAYKNAGGLDPSETMFLECHGTGTQVGDPVEVTAAGNVFGIARSDAYQDRLLMGSIKTNLGHLEGACALPGILKVVAALEAGEIPPTLGFKTPNPRIDFDKAKARVVADVEPWPENRLKRASVTSAGFGGTNGHCIIDHVLKVVPRYLKPGILAQHPGASLGGHGASEHGANGSNGHRPQHRPITNTPTMARKAEVTTRQLVLLPFSAHNKASLAANIEALFRVLDQHSLPDVAYTLAAKRSRFSQRAFHIVDKDDLGQTARGNGPQIFSSPQQVRIGFVFTGQGAQWQAMGAELFEYAIFRDAMSYLDHVLAMLPEPASWKIVDVLSGNCDGDLIQTPAVSQTVCTALQIGLVDLLASWSILPAGVVGHSSGEIAAAYAAGHITAAEAIVIASYRGVSVSSSTKKGAMLAVGLSHSQGDERIKNAGLEDQVKVAAINSGDSITMSGDADAIGELCAELNREDIFNRRLRTGGLAYHSHHMLPLSRDYAQAVEAGLEALGPSSDAERYPSVPWISTVMPEKSTTTSRERVTASYWKANMQSPVRFSEAVAKLLCLDDLGIGAVVEIGPHPALKSALEQIVKKLGKTVPHVASLKRGVDARRSLLDLAGTLYALNAPVNLTAVNAVDDGMRGLAHGTTAVNLPPYQYRYGPIKYHESRLSREYRLRRVPRHDLLGSKVAGTARLRPQWRNILRLKDLPWLHHHRMPPHVLHPGAAHIVMAMVAAEQAYAELPDALSVVGFSLRNVSIKRTLVVPEDDNGIEIVLSLELEDEATAGSPRWAGFSIASVARDSDQWTEHCSGLVKVEVSDFQQAAPIDKAMDGRAVDAQRWHKRFVEMGMLFGPSFQGHADIRADPNKNIASAKLALKTTAGMFPGGESSYPIHPASLDLAIRLGLMACHGGQTETGRVQLPIHLNQLRLRHRCLQGRDWVTGISRGELCGLRGACAQLQILDDAGDVALDVDMMRFTSLDNEDSSFRSSGPSSKAYASPFARLVWRPDVRTLSASQRRALFSPSGGSSGGGIGAFPQLSHIFDLLGHAEPDLRVLELGGGGDTGAAQVALKTLVGANGIKRYRKFAVTDVSQERLASARQSTSEFGDISYSVLDINDDPLQQGFRPASYDVVLWPKAPVATHDALENCRKLIRPRGSIILVEPAEDHAGVSRDDALQKAGFARGLELTVDEPDRHSTVVFSALHDEARQHGRQIPVVSLLHGAKGPPALVTHLARAMEERGLCPKIMPLDRAHDTVPPNSRVVAFLDCENLLLDADQRRLGLFQHLAANAASMVWITSCGMVKGRNPDGALVAGLLRTLGTENPAGQFLSVDVDAEDFDVDEDDVGELVRCLIDQELALQGAGGDSAVNRELAWQDGCMWISRIVPDAELQGYAEVTDAPDDHDMQMVTLESQGPVCAAFGTPGILTSLYFRAYRELWKPLARDHIEVKVDAVGLNWKDLGVCSGRLDQNNFSNEYCGTVAKKGFDVTGFEVGDRVYGMGKGHFGNYTRVPAALGQKLRPDADTIEVATMPVAYMTAVYAFEHVTRLRRGQKVLIQSASGGLGLAAIQLARSKGADIFVTAGTSEKARFLTESMGISPTKVFSSRDPADLLRMVGATKNGGFDVVLSTAQGDMLHESIKALAPLGHLVDVGRLDVTSSKNVALDLFQKSATFTSFDLGLVVDRDAGLGQELMRAVDEHWRAGRIGPIRPHTVSDLSQLDQVLLQFSKGKHIGKMVISYQNPSSIVKMHQSVSPAHFDPEARYILVGGLSGLGRTIVRWMCDRGARDLVVWSRSGADRLDPEAVALIDELAAQGVRIQPVTCDVSQREQVVRAVQDANADRIVRGVLHFAVSYQDISFDKMTEDKFHQGIAAKVLGTRNLDEATASLPLDFFVMTSSLGTVYAFPTQSAYLAANNFLDYFARYRRRRGLPASTVSLGFINDLGPLAQDPMTVNLFVRTRGQTVTGSQVLRLLEPAFMSQHKGRREWLGRSQDPLSEANIITGMDPAAFVTMRRDEAMGGPVPRWYHDARASLMLRAQDDAWRHHNEASGVKGAQELDAAADESPTAQLRRRFEASINRLRTTDGGDDKEQRAEAVGLVTDAVQAAVARLLFVDPSAVDAANTVVELGIDSLLAAEFRSWLRAAFGKNISMLDLMDARTKIHVLARTVVDEAVRP
ncbi:hypothetical protein CDD83_1525 [Cordyceps sp. RAO-2017]|nr:hypothetical protein CDD83_1525 [Cordyceps sp. RAO-2017]